QAPPLYQSLVPEPKDTQYAHGVDPERERERPTPEVPEAPLPPESSVPSLTDADHLTTLYNRALGEPLAQSLSNLRDSQCLDVTDPGFPRPGLLRDMFGDMEEKMKALVMKVEVANAEAARANRAVERERADAHERETNMHKQHQLDITMQSVAATQQREQTNNMRAER
ncbi:hypothetical protein KIPB_013799, partial [Kipferlia bialata]